MAPSKTSKLVLGTVQFGLNYGISNTSGKPNENEVTNILRKAEESGISMLDTAPVYGTAEMVIGNYLKNNLVSRFDVITKFHHCDGIQVYESVKKSIENTGAECIHTLLFHSFRDLESNPNLLVELKSLKENGKIKKAGVSVYNNIELVQVLEEDLIEVIQLPFNLLDNESLRGDVLRRAKDAGKTIHTRSAFLQGLFFLNPEDLPAKLIPLKEYLLVIHELRKEAGLSIGELALGYNLSKDYIDGIVIGVNSIKELEENVIYSQKGLDSSIVESIDKIVVNQTELLNPSNW